MQGTNKRFVFRKTGSYTCVVIKSSKVYTVIVGDLVGSRTIADRRRLGRKIQSALLSLSKEFQREFYAPLILTRGIDELCGVLKRSNSSFRICRTLNERIYPELLRFAVVRETLDIAVSSKHAGRMDGPAFHTAADLILKAKEKNLYYTFSLGFQFAEFDPWLNELTNLSHILARSLTKHQRNVVKLYEKHGRQKIVAEKLGITQQAVSDALQHAHWKDLKRAEALADRFLERVGRHK